MHTCSHPCLACGPAPSRQRRSAALTVACIVMLTLTSCGGKSSGKASGPAGGLTYGNTEKVDSQRAGAPDPKAATDTVKQACSQKASPTIARIQKAGTLNWGIGVSPPFGFTGPSGNWQGVEAENAVELAHILGVEPKILPYDYSVMTTALQSGKADIVGAQLFDTPERRQVIDFSEPYYKSGQIYYVRKDSPYQSIDDLNSAHVKFVYGTGGAQGGLAKKYTPKATRQEVPLQGQLIPYQFLATKRADATMGEAAALPVLGKRFTNPPVVAIGLHGRINGDLPSEQDVLDPFNVAFGLAKATQDSGTASTRG